MFYKYQIRENKKWKTGQTWKIRAPKMLKISMNKSWKSWIWDQYLSKRHELGNLVIWTKYVPRTLNNFENYAMVCYNISGNTKYTSNMLGKYWNFPRTQLFEKSWNF